MREFQNPQKEHSRFTAPANRSCSKDSSTLKKKSLKLGRKEAAPSIPKKLFSDTPEESSDLSAFTAFSDADSQTTDICFDSPFSVKTDPS
ncbi:hypothetical protein Tsubulata_011542 [Turnera subulata]|uniref:Uncharacterized protein n=1 Tax=Turnera subulata TaxID=218843 RepID=A0A9Q0GLY4_9ROSI|nr:hypothetical protein Tsubulata_011542 [Turnera subulata]